MKKKQWILLGVWYVAYMAALEFFRFKFGLFKISAVFLLVGIPLLAILGKPNKPRPN